MLAGIDPVALRAASTFVDDVRRECRLAWIGRDLGSTSPSLEAVRLAELGQVLVPHLEVITDRYLSAERTTAGDGTVTMSVPMDRALAPVLDAALEELLEVVELGRRGGLLVEDDPRSIEVVTWAWTEGAAQLRA